MAGRTSKKSEKVTKEQFYGKRNEFWRKQMGKYEKNNGLNIIDLNQLYPCFSVKITGHCSICDNMLTRSFPGDFPDEWKMCCMCKLYADRMGDGTSFRNFIENPERINKIRKLINLVG